LRLLRQLASGGERDSAGAEVRDDVGAPPTLPSDIVLTSLFGGIGNLTPMPGGASLAGLVIGAVGGGLVQAGQTLLQDFIDRFAPQFEQSPLPGTHIMVAGAQGK
jgi:hypothetical protein